MDDRTADAHALSPPNWRERLLRVLERVCQAPDSASKAAGKLRRLSDESLRRIDRILADDSRREQLGSLPLALPRDPSRNDDDALLFVHVCAAQAGVREHALLAFGEFPGDATRHRVPLGDDVRARLASALARARTRHPAYPFAQAARALSTA